MTQPNRMLNTRERAIQIKAAQRRRTLKRSPTSYSSDLDRSVNYLTNLLQGLDSINPYNFNEYELQQLINSIDQAIGTYEAKK